MKNIIAVSDLQRQAAQILSAVNKSSEPFIITQRGRPTAVIVSAKRYAEIEEDLAEFDDFELERLIAEGERARANGEMISHEEVKRRIGYPG